jgi:hypothetical protein
MIELPLSVVAWICVVLVQAIVHFVLIGGRREIANESPVEDTTALEECLSLATNDTTDDADSSFTLKDCGYQGTVLPSDPSSPLLGKPVIHPEPEQFFELLDQTGTELFKVSGIDGCINFGQQSIHSCSNHFDFFSSRVDR